MDIERWSSHTQIVSDSIADSVVGVKLRAVCTVQTEDSLDWTRAVRTLNRTGWRAPPPSFVRRALLVHAPHTWHLTSY